MNFFRAISLYFCRIILEFNKRYYFSGVRLLFQWSEASVIILSILKLARSDFWMRVLVGVGLCAFINKLFQAFKICPTMNVFITFGLA
jgi:hypothetical protein